MPSFLRFMQNAFPNFANDAKNDVDMTPSEMDSLLEYRLGCAQPRYLDARSMAIAGIVDNESTGNKLFKTLVKKDFLIQAPKDSEGVKAPTMTVNTFRIDKHFANHMSMISVHSQRKLVALLFFWEEECNRWRLLDEEEDAITGAMKAGQSNSPELQLALEAVRRKKKLLPSQRAEGASAVFPPKPEELPQYQGPIGQSTPL